MPTINLTLPVAGNGITAGLHATNYAALQALLNGDLDADNLADDGVSLAKIVGGGAGQYLGGTGPAYTYPPGYEFSRVEYTAAVPITATSGAAADLVVSSGAVVYDGSTLVKIEFFSPNVTRGSSYIRVVLYDGATQLGIMGAIDSTSVANPMNLVRFLTPSAASHTYHIKAYVDGGASGNVQGGNGASGSYMPGFIRVSKA